MAITFYLRSFLCATRFDPVVHVVAEKLLRLGHQDEALSRGVGLIVAMETLRLTGNEGQSDEANKERDQGHVAGREEEWTMESVESQMDPL